MKQRMFYKQCNSCSVEKGLDYVDYIPFMGVRTTHQKEGVLAILLNCILFKNHLYLIGILDVM